MFIFSVLLIRITLKYKTLYTVLCSLTTGYVQMFANCTYRNGANRAGSTLVR